MEDLTRLIDDLVQKKTFSLDAVGQIKELRDKAADLEQKLKISQSSGETMRHEIKNLEAACRRKDEAAAVWTGREASLTAREAKVTELEKTIAIEQARSGVWSSCFQTLFANRTVRESIQNSVPTVMPPSYPGGPPSTLWQTETKNVSREEG